jgi:NAD(P)-dependent dehydrogenase (short-subunit alcohol dehydrogenase family)
MRPSMTERDMTGKVVVITGASSGIGAAAARQLHKLGAIVHVMGRSPDRTAAVAAEMGTEPIIADFGRLADIRTAAAQVLQRCDRLDVLVNNAGLWLSERIETPDGNELMFGVNHLAPFLLTTLLTDMLRSSAPSRVITTASAANLMGFVRLSDLQTRAFFVGSVVYGTTKLENILFTRELGRRLAGTGVLATSLNPGVVATDLGRGGLSGAVYSSPLRRLMKTSDRGAGTLVWLATEPAERLKQGGYYTNRRPGLVNPQARHGRLARQLWDRTEKLLDTGAPRKRHGQMLGTKAQDLHYRGQGGG